MRDLCGVLDREKATMGALIPLQPPTRDMVAEAVSTGCYEHETIQDLTHCTPSIYIMLPPSRYPPPPRPQPYPMSSCNSFNPSNLCNFA